jgi:hypothetical protein
MNSNDTLKYLGGVTYPATKQELIDYAESEDTPQEALLVLEQIAEKDYTNSEEVTKEIERVYKS